MRYQAHVEKIISIAPIPDADRIEKATILGWEVVVQKKDGFKLGDLVVYIEIDSLLPDNANFEFMRKYKFRVKTIKLKNQVSQGLVIPISMLPNNIQVKEGMDVSEILGITKYDPEGDKEKRLAEEHTKMTKSKITRFFF
jgi:RNA ligase (TIGR02306 family)